MFLAQVSPKEVLEGLDSLDSHKANGPSHEGIILSAVVDTFDIDFTHARNTHSSTLGHIDSVYRDTTTYGTASWKVQGMNAKYSHQIPCSLTCLEKG